MKQPWWALAVLALLGAGIGVGSAALLGSASEATQDAATPSVPEPDATTPPTAASDTTATTADTETTEPDTSVASTTTRPPSTTSSSVASTTSSTTTTVVPQPPLDEIVVVVANAAATNGLAARNAELLRQGGYPNVETTNGVEIVDATVVYAAEGLEPTARRIVADLTNGNPDFVPTIVILPLAELPELAPDRPDADIVVYLGRDQT
jgi:hypothetical protein